jgi:hypothetical protein
MELALMSSLTVIPIRVSFVMGELMARARTLGPLMVPAMLVSSNWGRRVDLGSGRVAAMGWVRSINMRVSMKATKSTAMESSLGPVGTYIRESILKTRGMARVR